jgi:hypothetical protein
MVSVSIMVWIDLVPYEEEHPSAKKKRVGVAVAA